MQQLIQCWFCRATIETQDRYCRFCGKGQQSKIPFRYTHWGIILSTLLVGPLALWFVFKSPLLSQKVRMIYLTLNILLTLFFIYSTVQITLAIYNQMMEQMKTIEQFGIR